MSYNLETSAAYYEGQQSQILLNWVLHLEPRLVILSTNRFDSRAQEDPGSSFY